MSDLTSDAGEAATSGTAEGFQAPARAGRRGGGRAARQAARSEATAETRAYLTRTMAPFEVLSTEGLETIEYAADTILEEIGVDFRDYP